MKKVTIICGVIFMIAACNNAPDTTSGSSDSATQGADHTMSSEKSDTSKVIIDTLPNVSSDSAVVK